MDAVEDEDDVEDEEMELRVMGREDEMDCDERMPLSAREERCFSGRGGRSAATVATWITPADCVRPNIAP